MTPTRREFIGGAGAAIGLAATGLHCNDESSPSMTTVGFAHGTDVEATVRSAVALAGGMPDVAGKTVFIKPNAVYPTATPGVTTSPAVLSAVIKMVKEGNPKKITVGDRSARGFPTDIAFQTSGLGAAAMAAGADEVYAANAPITAPDEWMLVQPPHYEEIWSAAGGVQAMKKLLESDVVIAVPVMKDHRYANFSLGLKLFIGAIGDSSRDPLHYNLGGDASRLGRDICILNELFHPALTIIDGWTAMINGGPQGMPPDAVFTSPQVIVAGRDRLAIDAAGVSYLKLEIARTPIAMPDEAQSTLTLEKGVWDLPQLYYGTQLGLGVPGPDSVTLKFDGVADSAKLEDIFRTLPPKPDGG